MVETGLLNAVLQGLVTGSLIAAGALSLSLLYSIARVPNFAHGDMITIGAYLVLAFNRPGEIPALPDTGGLGLAVAAVLGILAAGVLGVGYELSIFRRFRAREAGLVTMIIVSLGLALVLQNLVIFLVGTKNVKYDTASVQNLNLDVYAGSRLTVEVTQRQAGEVVALASWGYAWTLLVAAGLVAVGVGYGLYRWRARESGFDTVHLLPPWVLGVLAALTAFVALAALLRGSPGATAGTAAGTRVTAGRKDAAVIGLTFLAMFLLNVLLKRTKLGMAMRATADNMSQARVKGVDVDRVQLVVWVVAAVLTALAGVLAGWFASNLTPTMGFDLLLPIFAAVILGGIDSPYGAAAGALIVGLSMDVGVFLLPPGFTAYRVAIAFVVLVVVLLVKPEGIWGGR
jgi:neutral amino acid transport system permease protein